MTNSVFFPSDCNTQQIQGAIAVLMKYVAMLHEHASQVLPLAAQVASLSPDHFKKASKVLQCGPCGMLLSELSVGLVLLQLRVPMNMVESDCVPLIGELLQHLDHFNRLAPGALKEDVEDLAWSDVKSTS